MRKQKGGTSLRPRNCVDCLVERASQLSGCRTFLEFFLRATLARARKRLNRKKAVAAYTAFLREGRLENWVSRIVHKIMQLKVVLPRLRPA